MSLTNGKILITGAAGFLGYPLYKQALQYTESIIGVDNFSAKTTSYLSAPEIIRCDITNQYFTDLVSQHRFDYVFHLAGQAYAAASVENPMMDFVNNLHMTLHMLEVLRKAKFAGHLIFASSAAVYGEVDQLPIHENTLTMPISPYGVSKLSSELYIAAFANLYGFTYTNARLFSLYGPRQCKQVVFDIMSQCLTPSGQITVLGDGDEIRDFLYVNDAASALLLLAEPRASDAPTVYNVCANHGVSVQDLVKLICRQSNIDPSRVVFSNQHRPGDPIHWIGDNTMLKALGFNIEYNLEHGLAQTYEWHEQHFSRHW